MATATTTTTMASRLKLSIPFPDFLHNRRNTRPQQERTSASKPRQGSYPETQQQQQRYRQPPSPVTQFNIAAASSLSLPSPTSPSSFPFGAEENHHPHLQLQPQTSQESTEVPLSLPTPPVPSRQGSIRAAHDFLLDSILSQPEWQAHGAHIRVDCPYTLTELHALGHLPRAAGLAACRRLVRAPVIHDDVALFLWTVLAESAQGPDFSRGDPNCCCNDETHDHELRPALGSDDAAAAAATAGVVDERFRFDRPASVPAPDPRRGESPPVSPRDTQRDGPRRRSLGHTGTGAGAGTRRQRQGRLGSSSSSSISHVDERDEVPAAMTPMTRGRISSRSGNHPEDWPAPGARPPRNGSFAGRLGSVVEGLGRSVALVLGDPLPHGHGEQRG